MAFVQYARHLDAIMIPCRLWSPIRIAVQRGPSLA